MVVPCETDADWPEARSSSVAGGRKESSVSRRAGSRWGGGGSSAIFVDAEKQKRNRLHSHQKAPTVKWGGRDGPPVDQKKEALQTHRDTSLLLKERDVGT